MSLQHSAIYLVAASDEGYHRVLARLGRIAVLGTGAQHIEDRTMADQAAQPTDLESEVDGAVATSEASLSSLEGDPSSTDAEGATSASVDATGTSTDGHEVENGDLLGELARAMHTAATSQYERTNAELERRRGEQVEAIAARSSSEVESLKARAETDISAIDAWATAETEKIKVEHLRRIDARREQLAAQLGRQEAIREREVSAIGVAIDAHRNEIDLFFGRIERETDPSAIARIASKLPPFPPLGDVTEQAGRDAAAEFASLEEEIAPGAWNDEPDLEPEAIVSETRLMAVMDLNASRPGDPDARPAWETAPYAVSVAAGTPVAEETREPAGVGSTLLRTVRSIRPMAGRHDEESNELGKPR